MQMRGPPIGITKDNDDAQLTTQLPGCRVEVTNLSSSDYSNMVFGLALQTNLSKAMNHADPIGCSDCMTESDTVHYRPIRLFLLNAVGQVSSWSGVSGSSPTSCFSSR